VLLLVLVRVKLPLKYRVVLFVIVVKRLVVEESENEVTVLEAGDVVVLKGTVLEITGAAPGVTKKKHCHAP